MRCMAAVVITFSQVAESEPRSIASALRRRDPEFIDRLVSAYHYRLFRYLLYLTSRREHAEDLVQETWMRVLEHAGQYNGRGRFEPWLFSIARHLAIDCLRRQQREGQNASDERCSDAASLAAPEGQSPFLEAAKSEDASRIAVAMENLDPIYREALLLRFQEELSLEEIAAVSGSPVSTVSSRIHRGLAILRSQLEGGADAV
jgi:RNA polymerase sigma-70 factor, ECF subfamily